MNSGQAEDAVGASAVLRVEKAVIRAGEFADCKGLEEADLSEVEVIEKGAFCGCTRLKKVRFRKIRDIGENAFLRCVKLEEVDLSASEYVRLGRGAFECCGSLRYIRFPGKIRKIPERLCCGCVRLQSAAFPVTLREIGRQAFRSTALEEILLPDGLEVIGEEAFFNCSRVVHVFIPGSVRQIGQKAFFHCRRLETLELHHDPARLEPAIVSRACRILCPSGGHTQSYACHFRIRNHGILVQEAAEQVAGSVSGNDSQPAEVRPVCVQKQGGKGKSMEHETLQPWEVPKRTAIRVKLKQIPEGRFAGDKELVTVDLSMAEEIGAEAFKNCVQLRNVRVKELRVIGDKAFRGCLKLESLDLRGLPIETIGAGAFEKCRNLKVVYLPDHLKQLPERLFYGCIGLRRVYLPKSLRTIGAFAFHGTSLVELELPKKLKTIEEEAFSHCNWLPSVLLPGSVEKVGQKAFFHCPNLKVLEMHHDPKQLEPAIVSRECLIKCPKGGHTRSYAAHFRIPCRWV